MRRHVIIACTLIAVMSITEYAYGQYPDRLGRLFLDVGERDKLDQVRKSRGKEAVAVESLPEKIIVQQILPEKITLDGYVTRSDGPSTTWINQNSYNEHDNNTSLIVRQSPNRVPVVSIKTPSGKRVILKAGDTVDVRTGKLYQVFEAKPDTVSEPETPIAKP
jgi:hypothetical protein